LEEEYPFKSAAQWRRPHEFMQGEIKVFDDGIDPNDIN
jgi:hypothetical protein